MGSWRDCVRGKDCVCIVVSDRSRVLYMAEAEWKSVADLEFAWVRQCVVLSEFAVEVRDVLIVV